MIPRPAGLKKLATGEFSLKKKSLRT